MDEIEIDIMLNERSEFQEMQFERFKTMVSETNLILDETKNIDPLLRRYDFVLELIDREYSTFEITNKREVKEDFKIVAQTSTERIVYDEVENEIQEAQNLKTHKGQLNRLTKLLEKYKTAKRQVEENQWSFDIEPAIVKLEIEIKETV